MARASGYKKMTRTEALDWANEHLSYSDRPAIALRGDDVIPRNKFRSSHHRPDGQDAGRIGSGALCAVSIRNLTYETEASREDFDRAYARARAYGQYVFLLAGDYASQELANDIDETWIYGHEIIAMIEGE